MSNVEQMSYFFASCRNLVTIKLGDWNAINAKNINNMFEDCSSLTTLDYDRFVAKNTSMSYMFEDCSSLTSLDLSKFEVSDITNMRSMFAGCNSLTSLDLSNFDTSKVTDM